MGVGSLRRPGRSCAGASVVQDPRHVRLQRRSPVSFGQSQAERVQFPEPSFDLCRHSVFLPFSFEYGGLYIRSFVCVDAVLHALKFQNVVKTHQTTARSPRSRPPLSGETEPKCLFFSGYETSIEIEIKSPGSVLRGLHPCVEVVERIPFSWVNKGN